MHGLNGNGDLFDLTADFGGNAHGVHMSTDLRKIMYLDFASSHIMERLREGLLLASKVSNSDHLLCGAIFIQLHLSTCTSLPCVAAIALDLAGFKLQIVTSNSWLGGDKTFRFPDYFSMLPDF